VTPEHYTVSCCAVLCCAACSARKAKVDDLRSKLQKLQEAASLVEQCTLFERAALWAQVKKQQADLDGLKFKLEVRLINCVAAAWARHCCLMAASHWRLCPG
jgi:hypothetical protein